MVWIDLKNGYSISPQESNYGGVKQRWIVVFSEEAFKNEVNTVKIMLQKKEEILKSALKKFEKELYYCKKDAEKSFDKFAKKHPMFILTSYIVRLRGKMDGKKGRPKEEDKVFKGFSVKIEYSKNDKEVIKHENARGKFILGTNDFDLTELPDEMILSEYLSYLPTQ
ncbi:MAG: hypothetical protein HQK49_11685 [Oligoflexia bacterium]|nr:hypothetical protein [Oligoflexia bacterium]